MPSRTRQEGILQLICLLYVLTTLSLTAALPAALPPASFTRNANRTIKVASGKDGEIAFGQSTVDGPATWPGPCRPQSLSYGGASTALGLQDNGYSTQVDLSNANRMGFSTPSGEPFDLQQLQFRVASEQCIEMHMIHESASGRIAIVGLRFDLDQHDSAQPSTSFLSPLTAALAANKSANIGTVVETFDFSALLSVFSASSHWIYMGSPATPPCSDDVLQFFIDITVHISMAEFIEFGEMIGHQHVNTGNLVAGGIAVVELEPAATGGSQVTKLVAGGINVVEFKPATASTSQTAQPPP
ncbi:hypothetical protein HDU87_003514 [Geranomyces variabilis]|uniref:carbonic anhydrase n=1 Tax=Geranomyces variabilis TaxID=109894 RepID=A0AAD5TLT4_9FUNG|nr:hypothetical protein HDU87_003514 [Geranomyces variabilis]